jgi:hypothetical protein
MIWKDLNSDVVLVIKTFGFRILARLRRVNFEFLISNFGFPDKQKIENSKACLVLGCPVSG